MDSENWRLLEHTLRFLLLITDWMCRNHWLAGFLGRSNNFSVCTIIMAQNLFEKICKNSKKNPLIHKKTFPRASLSSKREKKNIFECSLKDPLASDDRLTKSNNALMCYLPNIDTPAVSWYRCRLHGTWSRIGKKRICLRGSSTTHLPLFSTSNTAWWWVSCEPKRTSKCLPGNFICYRTAVGPHPI